MKRYLLLIIVAISLFSCGPNKEKEDRRKKQIADSITLVNRMDSIKIARIDSIAKALVFQKEQDRIHREKVEVGKSIKKIRLEEYLQYLSDKLVSAKSKLSQIKEFQMGRTSSEKRRQISKQNMKIDDIKKLIRKVKKEIAEVNLFTSYAFQSTPEGVVNYLFKTANDGDLSKIKNLIDPYGEFNDQAFKFCFVEVYSVNGQSEWKTSLKNGRIVTAPSYDEDLPEARVEIAVGVNSDRLKKLTLVRRMDKWYIKNL